MSRTFLAPLSFGLGDLVVSLPAIQALVDANAPVWLVARAPSQRLLAERIPGLAGVVDEDLLTCGPEDRLIDLRDHPLQRDFWWGSADFEAAFGALDINDILSRICADLGIVVDVSSPVPLLSHPRRDLARTVLLVHETDGPDKRWAAEHWRDVAAAVRATGLDVVAVAKDRRLPSMEAVGIPTLVLSTPGEAVDALTACRAVVGIDTGLTHIAAQQGTPTVTICRHGSVYFRPWAHCRVLRGGRCTEECATAESAYAYNDRVSLRHFHPRPRSCPSGAPCLDPTRPDRAVALLGEVL